jgi:hypothetical protein
MHRFLLVALAACGSGGGFPDAKIDSPSGTGNFSLAWSVTDTGGAAISCDTVGGVTVNVAVHDPLVENGTVEVFTCSTLMGSSMQLDVGTYDMAFELDAVSGSISTADPQQGVVISAGVTTQLFPVTFPVDATGGLALAVSAGKVGGNCAPVAQMGAGIDTMTLSLTHADGTCAPVTFDIAADGARPPSTYTVNCAAPPITQCIESDQKITVGGLASGSYRIHVTGKIGGGDCYLNGDSLQIPADGKTLVHPLNLAFQTGAPGC